MSHKKCFLITVSLILLLAIVGGCTAIGGEKGYTDVTPVEAHNLIANNPDIVIIDVSASYDQGHLPGAISSYNMPGGSLTEALPTLDKSKTYLVYCSFTAGSTEAAQKMVDAGFKNVYRLKGDYQGWVDAGFPVEIRNSGNI